MGVVSPVQREEKPLLLSGDDGTRRVIHSYADGRIEDTGPLTKQRMETVDEEFLEGALDFMDRSEASGEPFFLWFNSTRMHVWTHLKEESVGVTGQGIYADGMAEHDGHVGQILDKIEELGIADNTIVMYSTDNGAETFTWPDGGTIPFRGEKNTNWEGGYRVPMMISWPGHIPAGVISNEIMSHEDWVPTFMAAIVAEFVGTFADFPPRQRPASFSVDQIMENFTKGQTQ